MELIYPLEPFAHGSFLSAMAEDDQELDAETSKAEDYCAQSAAALADMNPMVDVSVLCFIFFF